MDKKVEYYKRENEKIICKLCPHECNLAESQTGLCKVRHVKDGTLYASNYGEISSISIDPIEKKPLFHYKPGSDILSCGTYGCNFTCGFCQNYSIAHFKPETSYMSPKDLVEKAESLKARGNIGVAFTYNEPFMYYEYMLDAAKACKEADLDVVVVSNGYVNSEPLDKLLPYVDAFNIDLKSFSNSFYKQVCSGNRDIVLKNIEKMSRQSHIELTTLLITGYNDSEKEMEEISSWIASLKRDIPLHLSRYYPTYKFTAPPTDVEKIMKLAEIAKSKIDYVYIGNVAGVDTNTYCPSCKNTIVKRDIYQANIVNKEKNCTKCGHELNIVF